MNLSSLLFAVLLSPAGAVPPVGPSVSAPTPICVGSPRPGVSDYMTIGLALRDDGRHDVHLMYCFADRGCHPSGLLIAEAACAFGEDRRVFRCANPLAVGAPSFDSAITSSGRLDMRYRHSSGNGADFHWEFPAGSCGVPAAVAGR